jgi:transcriptional regulator with XRE-family HTH domain
VNRGLGQEDKWVEKEWPLAERFAANVVWFRHIVGLTQQELADRVQMNRTSPSALERGLRLPRLDTILKLAAGLEVENRNLVAWMWWDPATHEHFDELAERDARQSEKQGQ